MDTNPIFEDWYEIIAIRFDDLIHFGQKAMILLQETGNYTQLISRAEFRMMTRFDLGDKWGKYADEMPTLFKLAPDTEFNIRKPDNGYQRI